MRKVPIAAAMLTSMALPAPAQAVDFVFNVPVRIENMRNVTSASVSCGVRQTVDGVPHALGASPTVPVPLVDGTYRGTVTVNFSAGFGYSALDATDWQCWLMYVWRMPDGSTFSRSLSDTDDRNALYTHYTGQEVLSSHLNENGLITR